MYDGEGVLGPSPLAGKHGRQADITASDHTHCCGPISLLKEWKRDDAVIAVIVTPVSARSLPGAGQSNTGIHEGRQCSRAP